MCQGDEDPSYVKSRYAVRSKGSQHYWVEVDYAYTVYGEDYCEMFTLDSDSESGAKIDMKRFPVGKTLIVRYNPKKPSDSVTGFER